NLAEIRAIEEQARSATSRRKAERTRLITGVSIGAFATKEIAHVFRLDEQLANRFALLTLPRWQFDDLEYAQLLATFERHLPLRRPSNLTGADLARHILTMAGGLIGGIATILRQAA